MSTQNEELSLAQKRKKVYDSLLEKDFQKAYDLAVEFRLHEPWRGYCAYHLAQKIILNDPRAHSGITADILFKEAAAAKFLGPFPHIYRLAALEKNESKSEREVESAFRNAVEAIEQLPVSKPLEDDEWGIDNYKNMFRLAAYYFGYPIEGASIVPPLIGDPSWILVGNDPRLAEQKLSKAFILEEIESLCKWHPEAVFFQALKEKLVWR